MCVASPMYGLATLMSRAAPVAMTSTSLPPTMAREMDSLFQSNFRSSSPLEKVEKRMRTQTLPSAGWLSSEDESLIQELASMVRARHAPPPLDGAGGVVRGVVVVAGVVLPSHNIEASATTTGMKCAAVNTTTTQT